MKQRLKKWRLFSIFAILTLVLSGCGEPFLSALKPAGEVAQSQYNLMMLSTMIMVFVIAVVVIIYVITLIRFRRKKGEEDKIPKQVEGSHKLEIIWTVIPILLLLILAVPTVASTFHLGDTSAMDKKDKDGKRKVLVVDVRANLYWWEFSYPDLGIITSQELVVPTDQKVYFNIISSDIKHSFWIPPIGGKLDANNDNVNKFWLEFNSKKSEEAGNLFYGKCAELCGPSHGLMDFKVRTMSQDDFAQWVDDMQNASEPQPATDLAEQGQEIFANSCLSCHATSSTDQTPEAGRVGPNLATFGERTTIAGYLEHDEEHLKAWIRDTQKYKPGNKMPSFDENQLSDQELDALVAYLMGLKIQQQ